MTTVEPGWILGSHAAIPPFAPVRPETVAEALAAGAAPGAVYFAGGIDQIRRMRDGAAVATLIRLDRIAALAGIEETAAGLRIGARTTHYRIETDPLIAARCPGLQAAWRTLGNVRVRMAGTVGGNLMAGEPNYDGPVILGALDARLVFALADGTARQAPVGRPAPEGALLTAIVIPDPLCAAIAFERTLKPAISLAAALRRTESGALAGRAVAGCAFDRPQGGALDLGGIDDSRTIAARADEIADDFAAGLPEPKGDVFASSGYRRRMARVLLARLLVRLAGEVP